MGKLRAGRKKRTLENSLRNDSDPERHRKRIQNFGDLIDKNEGTKHLQLLET